MRRLAAFAAVLFLSSPRLPLAPGCTTPAKPIAELPSQWRGFLLDQRLLRGIAVKPTPANPASPARLHYEEAAAKLAKLAKERAADRRRSRRPRCAVHPPRRRRPAPSKCCGRLSANTRRIFASPPISAPPGSSTATSTRPPSLLQVAVKLAPGKFQKAEELHLKLVRQRVREGEGRQDLDDLFGVRYVGESGKYEAGQVGGGAAQEAAERRRRATAIAGPMAAGRRPAAVAAGGTGQRSRRRGDGGGDHGRLRHRVRPARRGAARASSSRSRGGRRTGRQRDIRPTRRT